MKYHWIVENANLEDLDRWLRFVKIVEPDFHHLRLSTDDYHINAVKKNMKRRTALFVRQENAGIVGAMIYSPRSGEIGWIAVHPRFRRRGIGREMVNTMFDRMPSHGEFKVKTFREGDSSAPPARSFYRAMGFVPQEIPRAGLQLFLRRPMDPATVFSLV